MWVKSFARFQDAKSKINQFTHRKAIRCANLRMCRTKGGASSAIDALRASAHPVELTFSLKMLKPISNTAFYCCGVLNIPS
jgi:hypothetical protein